MLILYSKESTVKAKTATMGFSLDTLDPSLQCQGTRMNSLSIKEQAAQTVLKEVNELNRRKEQQTSQRLKRAEQYRIDNEVRFF